MTLFLSAGRLALVLAVAAGLHAVFNVTLPLSGDEAYYWVWSHYHLQAGYHDHPPAIAVLMAAFTGLLGDTVFAVRLVAVACMAGALWFIARTAHDLEGERVATLALLLGLVLPAATMGFTLATPDSPLVLFWAAGVYFGRRAVAGPGEWADFLAAGLCAGLAMASKYTGVLLPAAVVAFVLLRRRDLLASGRLWAAGVVALLAFLPVLVWNWQHGFESFAFQYKHGTAATFAVHWGGFFEFLGGQFLILSPVPLVLLGLHLAGARTWWRDNARLFLAVCFAVPFAVFVYKGLFAKIQLNWVIPAYISAIPLVADVVLARRLVRTAAVGAGLSALLSAVLMWPLAFGLSARYNPQNRLFGPEVAAQAVEALRRPGDSIFADHLQRASLLSFLLSGHPPASIPTPSRFSEYTRWDQDRDFASMHGLYLATDYKDAELRQVFPKFELVEQVTARRQGFREERYFIYRVGE